MASNTNRKTISRQQYFKLCSWLQARAKDGVLTECAQALSDEASKALGCGIPRTAIYSAAKAATLTLKTVPSASGRRGPGRAATIAAMLLQVAVRLESSFEMELLTPEQKDVLKDFRRDRAPSKNINNEESKNV